MICTAIKAEFYSWWLTAHYGKSAVSALPLAYFGAYFGDTVTSITSIRSGSACRVSGLSAANLLSSSKKGEQIQIFLPSNACLPGCTHQQKFKKYVRALDSHPRTTLPARHHRSVDLLISGGSSLARDPKAR
jgi:hypothetical protein